MGTTAESSGEGASTLGRMKYAVWKQYYRYSLITGVYGLNWLEFAVYHAFLFLSLAILLRWIF